MTTTIVRPRGVGAFVLLAFGLGWGGMFGAPLLGFSLADPLVQLPFGSAPAIAAVLVRSWVTREGFADAGMAVRLREHVRLYLAAWLGPFVLLVATCLTAAALGLWTPSLAALDALVPGVPGLAVVAAVVVALPLLAPIYWGEDFGWTSYLRLRVLPDRPLGSALVTGLTWAVWHYPLAFLGYIRFDDVVLGLAAWTVSFLGQEVLLSWLRIRSGSVWPATIAHAGNNMVLSLFAGTMFAGLDATTVTVLMTIPIAVAAVGVTVGKPSAAVPA